jgi:GNAT superfamily N-acetyltransferase
MVDEVQIRAARPADAALLLDLIRALADHEELGHVVEATATELARHLEADARVEALLAIRRKQAVGFAGLVYSFSLFTAAPTLIVDNLFVVPAARGQGIGRRLMAAAAARASARACKRLELTVSPTNPAARRFYRGLGFSALKEAPLRLAGPDLQALAAQGDAPR